MIDLNIRNSSELGFTEEKHFLRMCLIILNELDKMHSKKIIHGDIKPENIMYYQKNGSLYFILIDFGSSFPLGKNSKKSCSISLRYSAPEQNTICESFKSKFFTFFIIIFLTKYFIFFRS